MHARYYVLCIYNLTFLQLLSTELFIQQFNSTVRNCSKTALSAALQFAARLLLSWHLLRDYYKQVVRILFTDFSLGALHITVWFQWFVAMFESLSFLSMNCKTDKNTHARRIKYYKILPIVRLQTSMKKDWKIVTQLGDHVCWWTNIGKHFKYYQWTDKKLIENIDLPIIEDNPVLIDMDRRLSTKHVHIYWVRSMTAHYICNTIMYTTRGGFY